MTRESMGPTYILGKLYALYALSKISRMHNFHEEGFLSDLKAYF